MIEKAFGTGVLAGLLCLMRRCEGLVASRSRMVTLDCIADSLNWDTQATAGRIQSVIPRNLILTRFDYESAPILHRSILLLLFLRARAFRTKLGWLWLGGESCVSQELRKVSRENR